MMKFMRCKDRKEVSSPEDPEDEAHQVGNSLSVNNFEEKWQKSRTGEHQAEQSSINLGINERVEKPKDQLADSNLRSDQEEKVINRSNEKRDASFQTDGYQNWISTSPEEGYKSRESRIKAEARILEKTP